MTAAARPNLFIKIPGTKEGLPAIDEAIFSGVPVNVTLLFSREHYLAAADAYMRGLERRIEPGLSPDVRSVASLFVSRWDKATMEKLPAALRDRLGIAVAQSTYAAYRDLLDSDRWQRLENVRRAAAAPPVRQHRNEGSRRVRTRSTSARWPPPTPSTPCPRRRFSISPIMGLVSGALPRDGGEAARKRSRPSLSGGRRCRRGSGGDSLQSEGAKSFDDSWSDLLKAIDTKSHALG